VSVLSVPGSPHSHLCYTCSFHKGQKIPPSDWLWWGFTLSHSHSPPLSCCWGLLILLAVPLGQIYSNTRPNLFLISTCEWHTPLLWGQRGCNFWRLSPWVSQAVQPLLLYRLPSESGAYSMSPTLIKVSEKYLYSAKQTHNILYFLQRRHLKFPL
jgi:hypothetical protein